MKGGAKSTAVWAWHMKHRDDVGLRSDTSESVSVSVSDRGSSSSSVSDRDTSSSREDASPPLVASAASSTDICIDCRRPTSVHAPSCPAFVNPALWRVG
jgi:hypothetical protein